MWHFSLPRKGHSPTYRLLTEQALQPAIGISAIVLQVMHGLRKREKNYTYPATQFDSGVARTSPGTSPDDMYPNVRAIGLCHYHSAVFFVVRLDNPIPQITCQGCQNPLDM